MTRKTQIAWLAGGALLGFISIVLGPKLLGHAQTAQAKKSEPTQSEPVTVAQAEVKQPVESPSPAIQSTENSFRNLASNEPRDLSSDSRPVEATPREPTDKASDSPPVGPVWPGRENIITSGDLWEAAHKKVSSLGEDAVDLQPPPPKSLAISDDPSSGTAKSSDAKEIQSSPPSRIAPTFPDVEKPLPAAKEETNAKEPIALPKPATSAVPPSDERLIPEPPHHDTAILPAVATQTMSHTMVQAVAHLVKTANPAPKASVKVIPMTGTHPCTLDESRSLVLPDAVREQMGECDTLYLTPGTDLSLWVTTARGLEQLTDKMTKSESDEEGKLSRRRYFALTQRMAVDKEGRVTLPAALAVAAELKTEVMVVGVGDHLEIWDSGRWQKYVQTRK